MGVEVRDIALIIDGWEADRWATQISALVPDRSVYLWPEIDHPSEIAYGVVWKPQPGALAKLPNLKAVFNLGAGVDFLFKDPDLPDVPIVRVVDDSLTTPMSEYIACQVLLHHRQHLTYAAQQRAGQWRERRQPFARDVTVGILGFGTLGHDAADKLLALGFNVRGWSRSKKHHDQVESFAGKEGLEDFLAGTDILVSLLPATPETRHMIDRQFLNKLRPDGPLGGPSFINAGRGDSQVESDILDALDAGELRGASLDVFETEPLDPASPFWHHERVIITPHAAAATDRKAISAYVYDRIIAFEAGKPLAPLADPAKGY